MNGAAKSQPGSLEGLIGYLESQNGQRSAICAFSIVAAVVLAAFPGTLAAYVFGVPFMFFVPGFAVVRMFFWKDTTPETRFVLSMGISVLVVIALGLLLVLTPLGLGSNTTRGSLVVFAVAAVAVEALWLGGRRGAPAAEGTTPRPTPFRMDKVTAAMLVTALAISAVSLGMIVTAEYPSRTYFALTDESGNIITNPSWVQGTNLTFVVHMKNGEDGPRNFTLLTYGISSGFYSTQNFSRILQRNEVWNQTISFLLAEPGYPRIDFDLYIQNGAEPPYLYGNLHIWVRVLPS